MIEEYFEKHYLQEYKEVDDGFGGIKSQWMDLPVRQAGGKEISGLYRQSMSDKRIIAEAESVISRGDFITGVDARVGVGDVIRRERDGAYIKLVGMAMYSPAQAVTQIKRMTAEIIERSENIL
jgi:hypothetical protein